MATRLYLGPSFSVVTPTPDASWEQTTGFTRGGLSTAQGDQAFANLAISTALNSPAGAVDVLIAQYVSAPLASNVTISGTISGQIRALESNSAADLRSQCVIWVRKSDGTSRGTLVASDGSALTSEWDPTTLTNRHMPLGSPVTPTSVAALATDRIVVEIGYRKHENATTSRTGTLRVGSPVGTDLPQDETTTADDDAWIEFADALSFTTNARITQLAVESLETASGHALVTQQASEVLRSTLSTGVHALVTQLAVEVLHATVVPGGQVIWFDDAEEA